MGGVAQALAQRRVFINVPYDAAYEKNFLALISALISIGRIPRCAAEERVLGRVRVDQIFKLIKGCEVSIHDLCRVTRPPRFNIPFELGIAYALSRLHGHKFIVLEVKKYRSDVTLSDLKGVDCFAHGNKPRRVISCVLPGGSAVEAKAPGIWNILSAHRQCAYRGGHEASRELGRHQAIGIECQGARGVCKSTFAQIQRDRARQGSATGVASQKSNNRLE